MSKVKNIAGIRDLEVTAAVNKGELEPPPGFEPHKFVGKWAKKGNGVQKAQQPQRLGNGQVADGWVVFKGKGGRICQKSLSSGVYVFMVRPKGLQKAVNAIHGNMSKERLIREHRGETIEGEAAQPFGMLTNEKLSRVFPSEAPEELQIPLNQVEEPETASAAKASAKPKTKFSIK